MCRRSIRLPALLCTLFIQPPFVAADTGSAILNAADIGVGSFGERPNIVIYDRFTGCKSGEAPLDNAEIGRWTGIGAANVLCQDEAMLSRDDGTARQIRVDFEPATEFFLSYKTMIPEGTLFPGTERGYERNGMSPPQPRAFPYGSTWKLVWISDKAVNKGVPDVVVPTYVSGKFRIGGNDVPHIMYIADKDFWWVWDDWNHIQAWLKAPPGRPTAPGEVVFMARSKEKGYYRQAERRPIFDNDGPSQHYSRMGVPGWLRPLGGKARPMYDDIYLATGPGSQKRIEICDAPDYEDATVCEIQVPVEWTPTRIRYKPSMKGHVFYIDAEGRVHD